MIKLLIFVLLVGFFLRIQMGFFLEDRYEKASQKICWMSFYWNSRISKTTTNLVQKCAGALEVSEGKGLRRKRKQEIAYSLTNSVASLEGKPATDRACSVQVRELLFNPQARSLRLITHSAGGLPLSSL